MKRNFAQDLKVLGLSALLLLILYPGLQRMAARKAGQVARAAAGPQQMASFPVSRPEEKSVESDYAFPVLYHDRQNIISVFGDQRGSSRLHKGIDIKAPKGTPVVAVTDGFIERVREGGAGGKQIYLRSGDGRQFYYAHLDDWKCQEMDVVSRGQVIGYVGDTGNARSTTPHLHFEIMVGKRESIDPEPVLFP